MKKINVEKVMQIIGKQDIKPIGLILHGSSTLDVQNKESDIDILGVVNEEKSDELVEIIDGEKYHIGLRGMSYLDDLAQNFTEILLNRISDFNTLSGRILSGKVLWEQKENEINLIINRNISKLDKTILDAKLRFQMLGQLKDATTENRYINYICIQNAVDTLICRFLLKKNIFFLNQKWFPYYVEKYFSDDFIRYYFNLRFSQSPDLIEFKKMLDWIDNYDL